MDEYIKREAAIEAVKHAWAKGLEPSQYIEIITAADVAPVRHGRWIIGTGENRLQTGYRECSRCGEIVKYGYSLYGVHNFCNYCGADMRGSNDEKVREDRHEAL